MKKIYIILIVLAAVALLVVAANDWPARLTVRNQTDEAVIISMEYPYSWLYVPAGTKSVFHIEKDDYTALVTACGETVSGTINLKHNLKLNFTPCYYWSDSDSPKYLGEPGLEKPNWNRPPKANYWRFQY